LADGRPILRRVVGLELAITTVILSLTAVLVQTTPARTASSAAKHTEPVEQALRTENLSLQVIVFPAQTGANTVHLLAFTPEGKPLPVAEWRGTAALPSVGIEPIDVPLTRVVDNHVIGELNLPVEGTWQLQFTVRTSQIDQRSVTGPMKIS
jgi:copper transport protein